MDSSGTFTNNTFNLGTSTAHWRIGYFNSITIGSQTLADYIKDTAMFDAIGTNLMLEANTTGSQMMNASFILTTTAKVMRLTMTGNVASAATSISITVSDNATTISRRWRGVSHSNGNSGITNFNDWFDVSALSATVTVLVQSGVALISSTRVFINKDF